jgi:hypothetical protein
MLIFLPGQAGHAKRYKQEEDSQISNHERTIARSRMDVRTGTASVGRTLLSDAFDLDS